MMKMAIAMISMFAASDEISTDSKWNVFQLQLMIPLYSIIYLHHGD